MRILAYLDFRQGDAETPMIKERYEKVKKHIQDHKVAYSCAVTGVMVAGITVVIMRSNIVRGAMGDSGVRGAPTNTASFTFRNKQTINVTTVLDREGRGHPGWPVRNIETKRIFFSQREAADTFDISYSALSGHLNGKFSDVDGLHFERISLGVE